MRPDRGRHRRRRPWFDRWDAWGLLAVFWGWVVYRAAELELPAAVVITTAIAAALAATAGYLAGRDHRSDTDSPV